MKDKFKNRTRLDLMNFLWDNRNSNNSLYNILDFFPDNDPSVLGFSRQHVFEAIGQILLFLRCDNISSNPRNFRRKLGDDKDLGKRDILENDLINQGSDAGISDIYFKENDKNIVIQCKYLSKEKSDSDKYNVGKLFTRTYKIDNKKLIIFVNNKEELFEKIKRSRNDDFQTLNGIYGMGELNNWYQNMVKKMSNFNSLDDFINNSKGKKQYLNLKFHQRLCTETVLKYNEKEDGKNVLIGAVARSGKSYMIADLITKRKTDISILILGAITETSSGFKEIFEKYEEFSDYDIIDKNTRNAPKRKKRIYIYSQQKIKTTNIRKYFQKNKRKGS